VSAASFASSVFRPHLPVADSEAARAAATSTSPGSAAASTVALLTRRNSSHSPSDGRYPVSHEEVLDGSV